MANNIRLIKNEQFVLACLLYNKEFLDIVKDETDLPFISELGKDIFNAVVKLTNNDLTLTNSHILSELTLEINDDILDKIREVANDIDTGSYKQYYKQLKEEFAKHRFSNHILKNTVIDMSKKNEFDVSVIDDYIKQAEKCKYDILGNNSKLLSGEELLNKYKEKVEKRFSGELLNSYGCSHLDKIIVEGAGSGSITSVIGSSGSGKTTYVANHLKRGLLNRRVPLIEISTEMSLEQSVDRYICNKYKVPLKQLHPKNTDEDDTKKENILAIIDKELESIKKNKMYKYIHESYLSLDDIEIFIQEAMKEMGVTYAVVIIDLLSMVKEFGIEGGSSRADNIEMGMNRLNHISKKEGYSCHIIATIQTKREKDKQVVKTIADLDKLKADTNSIKSSNAYLERSRVVISLFRPYFFAKAYFKEDDPQMDIIEDIMEATILKQNQGEVGKRINYLFNGELFKLTALKNEVEES